MDGIEVSDRSVSRYRFLLTCYYKEILSKTLQLALDLGLTDFDHVTFERIRNIWTKNLSTL